MSSSSRRCLKLLERCKNMNQLRQAHAHAITCGLGANSFALSRLLAFCANPNRGSLTYACNLFQRIENPTICICNTMIKALLMQMSDIEPDEAIYQRDVVSWNAMISGMAMHGDGESALELFWQMEKDGVRPDDITFIAVFSACSYSGMAFEGLTILDRMCKVYNIEPKSEHFGCIIDLLSRGGLFEEANKIIQRMPDSSNPSDEAIAWRALLSSCCSNGQTKLAEVAAEKLMQLEDHSGVYVLLSNLYAASGKYYDAKIIKQMMKNRGVNKVPGCSSVKINGVVHEFIAGEKSHPQMEDIHLILEKLEKQMDYRTIYI
ncbi:Pentatricopeptide repeat - like 10 [Theobroma cacao]|nr:Pentatricopeptide repeat - like 10 [Theobroma cacao]